MGDPVRLGMVGSGFIAEHYLAGLRWEPVDVMAATGAR
jgi:hypothetical protein